MMEQLSFFEEKHNDPRPPLALNWNLWHGYIEKYRTSDGRPLIEEVSVGGESGANARVCDYKWVEKVWLQCKENGISFYYHQTGAKLIKDGKLYNIPRKLQHIQAHKAGLDL
ncbi:DUF5131 family protein [Butyrivibrio sp. WCD3002]|uniref:DUF5131 family protein n=1 Tax=Butyrivibrio sp. WCD3002 TaxID=1280676 RepID=UPI000425E387|nr:DUF5131 family protein [Butyrivibrio sp. WCD3002]